MYIHLSLSLYIYIYIYMCMLRTNVLMGKGLGAARLDPKPSDYVQHIEFGCTQCNVCDFGM